MSKHTSGPWYIEVDHSTNEPEFVRAHCDGDMFDIASLLCDETGSKMANARLIAAAPDLLDALVMVLDDPNALDGRPRTYEIVCAAIAKAKGEA